MKRLRVLITVFLLIFFTCFWCYAGSQQTSTTLASAVVTNARSYLNESTATFWTDAQLLVWLNEGLVDIAARSHCIESIETETLETGRISYQLSSNFLGVKAVMYNSYDEYVQNGSMELDVNWNDDGTPTADAQSSDQAYQGTYSRMFTVDAADEGIKSDTFTTVTGTTYYYRLWVYPDDATSINVYVKLGDDSGASVDSDVTTLVQDAWNAISGSWTETGSGGSSAYFSIRSMTGVTSGDWYVDEVHVFSTGYKKALRRGSIEHIGEITGDLGEPSYWTEWGNAVIVYPPADSTAAGNTIDVYLAGRPSAVVTTDYVPTPANYDRALTYYIVSQALWRDEKYAASRLADAMYKSEIDRFRSDYNDQPALKDIIR